MFKAFGLGLLLAALYNPVWTAEITGSYDFALAVAAFLLLFMWQTPPWLAVVLSAVGGRLIAALSKPRQGPNRYPMD